MSTDAAEQRAEVQIPRAVLFLQDSITQSGASVQNCWQVFPQANELHDSNCRERPCDQDRVARLALDMGGGQREKDRGDVSAEEQPLID